MAYLGSWKIDDYLCIHATTHRFSSGAAYAPSSITYRIYEDDTTTEIVSDTAMTNFDSVVGLYLNKIQLLAATGFEKGKNYTVLIQATVDSVAAITVHTFQIEAEVDSNTLSVAPTNFSLLSIDGTGFVQLKALTHAGATIPTVTSVGTVTGNVNGSVASVTGAVGSVTGNVGGSVASVTGAVGSVTGAVASVTGNVGGSVASVVGNVGGNVVGSVASVTGAVGSVTGAVGSVTGNVGGNVTGNVTGSVGSVLGNVGGNVVGSVASVTGAVASVTGNLGGNVTGSVGSISGVTFPSNFNVLSIDATEGRVKIQPNSNRFAKNTAFSNFEFLMVDSTTGDPKTGLTVTATRSIDGAAFGTGTLGSVTEVGNGVYKIDLPAADLNGEIITFRFVASGAKDRLVTVVTQAV